MAEPCANVRSVRRRFSALPLLLTSLVLLSTCDLAKVGLGNKVDIRPPEITIDSPANNAYISATLPISGTVADDLGVSSVRVVIDGVAHSAAVTGGSWSLSLPTSRGAAASEAVADGRKKITAVAVDSAGKERSTEIEVNVDTRAPFVLLTVPQGYGSAAGTYTGYIDFKGETWDPSPVDKVEVVVIDQATKAEIKRKRAEGTSSWSIRFTIGAGKDLPFSPAESGNTYLYYVEATDRAGNVNSYAFHSQDIWNLMSAHSIAQFPVASELGAMDQEGRDSSLPELNGLGYADLHAQRINEAPYNPPPVSDFKYDADGSKPVIKLLNIDPANAVTANVVGSKTPILGFVSPGPTGAAVDGNSIQATISPLSPTGADITLASPTLNGTTVVNFQFALKNGAAYLPNGRYRITVSAQAAGGSAAAPVPVDFLIDNTVPQFVRLSPGDDAFASRVDLGGGKGMGVRLDVVVNDDNDTTDGIAHSILSSVAASSTDGGAALPGVTIVDGLDVVESGVRIGRRWIVDVPYAAGTELFLEYSASDSGGSTAQRSQHLTIDEMNPTATISDPPAELLPVGALLSADSYIFRGVATDGQSGVGEVRWWLGERDGSDLPGTASAWHLASGLGSWSATQDFTSVVEGRKRLFARSKDAAGNWSDVATVDLTYDKANPIATMVVGSTAKGYAEGGVEYREGAFILSGDCDDDAATPGRRASSVSLSVSKDGGAEVPLVLTTGGAATGEWTYAQAVDASTHADDGLYVYKISVVDEAGRPPVEVSRTVRIDTKPPEVEVKEPAPNEASLASSYTFKGTARDEGSAVDAATLVYRLNGSASAALALTGATWKAENVALGGQGTKILTVACADRLGNAIAPIDVTFYYDLDKPLLDETTAGTTDTRNTKVDVAFAGSVSDTNGLSSLMVRIDGGPPTSVGVVVDLDGADNVAGTPDDGGAWSYLLDVDTDGAGSGDTTGIPEGLHSIEFVVTDVAGKTSASPVLRSVRVDTTPPTLPTYTGFVGWRPTESNAVSGTAADPGSGIAIVEYKLNGGGWQSLATAPRPAPNPDNTADWSGNIAIPDGVNTLSFRALDKSGMYSAEVTQTVYIDLVNPEASVTAPSTLVKVNGHSDLAATITLKDLGGSGIAALKLKIGSNDFSSPDAVGSIQSGTINDGAWAATLPAATIHALADGQQYDVYAQASDGVGRKTTVSFPILLDKTPPTAAFSVPLAASTVNKTIALAGTAGDDQALASLKLEVLKSDLSWETLQTFAGTAAFNWSVSAFDTAAYGVAAYDSDGAAGIQLTLRATAADAAGNLNETETLRTFTVDQNSDRPVLKLTNLPTLDGSTTLKMSRTVFGTVFDDDGAATLLEASEDGVSWTVVPLDGGTWSRDASSGDGLKRLHFRVTDAKGAVFTTDAASPLDEPRIQLGAGYLETYAQYRVDTVTPEFAPSSAVVVDRTSAYDFGDAVDLGTNMAFGGSAKVFAIRALAKDANGVASVKVTVPGAAGSPFTASPTGSDVGHPTFTRFDTGLIDVSAVPDGSVIVTIEATDASGLTSTATRTVVVDNTPPTLSFINPASAAIVNGALAITGSASDGGSGLDAVTYRIGLDFASDADSAVSGTKYLWEVPFVDAAEFHDPSEANEDSYTGKTLYILPFIVKATDLAGNVRETVPITGSGATRPDTTTLAHASLQGASAAARVKVGQAVMIGANARIITAYDSGAGAITWSGAVPTGATGFSVYEYCLRVNPDGDSPEASIIYPLTNTIMGGNVRIYGSATDDDAVSEVYMQIDTNGDDMFTAADDAIGDWYSGDGVDDGKKVTGSASWNATINESREFDPVSGTKKLNIRVRSKDIYGKLGAWSTPVTVFINRDVPQIGSSAALVLDPDSTPGNGNEIPYVYGMYLKGSWRLRGSIESSNEISSVAVTGNVSASLSWNGSAYAGNTGSFSLFSTSGLTPGMYRRIDLDIPINAPANASEPWNFTVTALDNQDPKLSAEQSMKINIDTKSPSAGLLTPTSSSSLVVQSNGWYKIKGTTEDLGSDIDRVEVYFVRRGNGSTTFDRIYNPLKTQAAGNVANLASIAIDTDGSPSKSGSADSRTVTSLVDDALIGNPLINVGQKLLVGSQLRTISVFNSATGTISWADGAVDIGVTAYTIRLAIQIDHKDVTERWISGDLDSDDGDGYLEYLKQDSGTAYTWFVDIDSLNIPDGPIEIHWVTYDKAGNATHGQTPAKPTAGFYRVQNNGPRVAAVVLGTDLDASGAVTAAETTQFPYLSATSESETITAAFAVKNGPMTIEPVVTNGNGDLIVRLTTTNFVNAQYDLRTSGTVSPILLSAADLATITDGARTFSMVIWDSTEETTQGLDSLFLARSFACSLAIADASPPYLAIRPFHWNGSGDNSIFGNSQANGHIDITSLVHGADPDVSGKISFRGVAFDETRIVNVYAYLGDGTAAAGDFSFSGQTTKTIDGLTYRLVASYAGGVWTGSGSPDLSEKDWCFSVPANAIGQSGHRIDWRLDLNTAAITNGAARDRVLMVRVEDKTAAQYNGQAAADSMLEGSGSRSNRLTLTDAALKNQGVAVGLPVILYSGTEDAFFTRVEAFDNATGKATLVDEVDVSKTSYRIFLDAHNAPGMQVDVVPYVKDISRKTPFVDRLSHLSGKEGWYPFYQGQAGVEISGFNLPYASAATITGNGTVAVGATTFGTAAPDVTAAAADRTKVTVTIPAVLASGSVVVTTNSVPSVNNQNSGLPDYNQDGAFTDDRTIYIDDIAPMIHIAPFGRRFSASATDGGKTLDSVLNYNENIVMVDGPDVNPDLDARAGHVEYAEFSNFSAIGVSITPATDVVAATAHGLSVGQMVSLRFATAPQLAPAASVAATDLFYVVSDGFGANAFKLSSTPGGAAADFATAGVTVTVVDPEVSGQVVFRGKAYDDQRIKRISMTIAGFNGGPGVGQPFDVYTTTTVAGVTTGTPGAGSGWDFDIDGADQVIDSTRITRGHVVNWALSWDSSAIATTAAANTLVTMTVYDYNDTPHTATMSQSVDVVPYVGSITRSLNTNRSKMGKYPLRNSETDVTVNGFNLFTSTVQDANNWIRVYSSAAGGNADADALTIEASPVPTKTSFQMTMNANSNSGWFRLAVAGVEAINAINDNAQEYNREVSAADVANTQNWNDDRYLMLFRTGDSFRDSADPEYISMSFDPNTNRLVGEWSNSGYAATYYATPVADGNTINELFSSFDPPTWTDIFADADGQYHSVILEDYNNGGTTWGYLASYINLANRVSIERLGDDDPTTPGYADGMDEKMHQFRNARIAVRAATNDQYVSYYDYFSKTLKYARMLAGANTMTSETTHRTDSATVVDGVEDTSVATTDPDVGVFSDIQVDDVGGNDATTSWRPVIVYYDNTNEKLKIARGNSSSPSGTANWTIQDVDVTATAAINEGKYLGNGSLSMKIDPTGGLHIVTRNGMSGGLYYIHAANVDGTASYVFDPPVCIDPQTADGSWADITLNGNLPLVSYKNGTSYNGLKYAYVQSGSGLSAADWEYMIVPAATAVNDQRTNIEYTADATDFPYDGNVAFGYAASNFQIVYLRRQVP